MIEVPTRPGDEPLVCPMRIRRTRRDPTRKEDDGNGPVTYVNAESHWWDGSQIYGSSEEAEGHLRDHRGGRLALDDRGLLLMEENALERTGLSANWWIGLSLMHNLFAREHNAICDHLRREYPGWDDDQLYRTARLVNVALMAKIHTLEWTPAILGHPVLQVGMKGNWWGFATERIKKVLRRISEGELVSGIPGSETNHHGADYCLTEEFVSVYRMHALMPDRVAVYRVADGKELETRLTLDAEKDRTSVDVVSPGGAGSRDGRATARPTSSSTSPPSTSSGTASEACPGTTASGNCSISVASSLSRSWRRGRSGRKSSGRSTGTWTGSTSWSGCMRSGSRRASGSATPRFACSC